MTGHSVIGYYLINLNSCLHTTYGGIYISLPENTSLSVTSEKKPSGSRRGTCES